MRLGDLLIDRARDLPAAKQRFEAALAADPEHVGARQGLERVAIASGDSEALRVAFEREAETTSDRARLAFLVAELARIYEEEGASERALHWWSRLATLRPEDENAWRQIARLQEALGQHAALAESLARLDPLLGGADQLKNRRRQAALAATSGDAAAAKQAHRAVLALDPEDLASARALAELALPDAPLVERIEVQRRLAALTTGAERVARQHALGCLLMDEAGDLRGAGACFEEIVDADGAPADSEERYVALLQRLGEWEALAARLDLRRRLLDPLDPRALELDLDRADLLLERLARSDEAIALYDAVLEARPRDARARASLERALRKSGRDERLVALLATSARDEGDRERRALLELERAVLFEERLRRLPEAREVLGELARSESGVAPEARARLRNLLEVERDWAALAQLLEETLGGGPASEELARHQELAGLYRDRLRDPERAAVHLRRALEIAPASPGLLHALQALLQQLGHESELLAAFELELAGEVETARAQLLHGRCAELAEQASELARAEAHHRAIVALDPSAARSVQFLAERYESDGRSAELAGLLRDRLALVAHDPSAATALRLRIATLEAGPLADPARAIDTLRPSADAEATLLVVAEPLADLLQREKRPGELAALALRVAPACEDPSERGGWLVRAGDALVAAQRPSEAADAYRRALADRPDDRDLQGSLRDLYRRLGEAEPLARLLDTELGRVVGPTEVPLRLELADLLGGALARPADGLVQLRRVLELEPRHLEALERAIALAERAGAHAECADLLRRAALRARDAGERSRLLTRRGVLLAGPLGRHDEAIAAFEAALAAEPNAVETLAALRGVREERGDWAGVLACFEREFALAPPDALAARAAIAAEAANFAREMLDDEASLPWLERLRAARPSDAEPLARIAHVHRSADRPEALLRTLGEELALGPAPARRVALALEVAELYAERLQIPARAVLALEAVRASGDPRVLERLDALYDALGRDRDRLGVLKERIGAADLRARLPLRRAAARLARRLEEREESAGQVWATLQECGPRAGERIELLCELGDDLRARGRGDLWVRAAEAELAELAPDAPVFKERRRTLRFALADAYARELARPELAIAQLSTLLDKEIAPDSAADRTLRARAGEELIPLLRRVGDPVALERRLSLQLAEHAPRDAAGWLELGRLRLDVLHRPAGAAEAFSAALALAPDSLPALRALRAASELLGRWDVCADCLERELSVRPDVSGSERAGLLRRIGQVAWHRLDQTTRASRAFAAALEAEPNDLVSLHSLEQLFEAVEDWRGALSLYESEVSALGEAQPERRQRCWLRAAELAWRRTQEPARALRAFDAAAKIAPLSTPRLAELAELLDQLGERARFAETLGRWVDAPDARAGAEDELRIAAALEALERLDAALERAERAVARDPAYGPGWDSVATLRQRLGREREAAEAWVRAAGTRSGAEAAVRRMHAADLLLGLDAARAVALLEQATLDEPLHADAFAKLALAAERAGDLARAEAAASRAINLASDGAALTPALRKQAALIGARAAQALDHPASAARLLADVLAQDPEHAEALGQQGRTLLRLGDIGGARRALERALGRAQDARDRALTLALLGNAESAARAPEAALAHYRAALTIEAGLEEAHAGLVQVLVREGRDVEAVEALCVFAKHAQAPRDRAARLLQAAELELSREGRAEAAEAHLRAAVAADASFAPAWALLAELQARGARWSELQASAAAGLAATADLAEQSRLLLLRGRAQEQLGDLRAAAADFTEASARSPRASEAALSAARLLRGLGEWQPAADVLRGFVERAPSDARSARATALHQLGRLLAGPLEDVDGAVEVYRQAVQADPEQTEGREALADLLLHRPRHWDEAVTRHRELLARNPGRLPSLRGLLRIARGRGNAGAASAGLVILRALGVATAEESREAPARLPFPIAPRPGLSDPRRELARRLAQEAAPELGEALGGARIVATPRDASDGAARFRAAVTAVEGELSAAALVPLATPEVAKALILVAELGSEAETVSGDGAFVNALSQAFGWRARKRLRRLLEGHSVEEVATLDFELWRREMRGLASAVVLDRGEGNLREAFLAWIHGDDPDGGRTLTPEADVRVRVVAQPEARALLELTLAAWLANL